MSVIMSKEVDEEFWIWNLREKERKMERFMFCVFIIKIIIFMTFLGLLLSVSLLEIIYFGNGWQNITDALVGLEEIFVGGNVSRFPSITRDPALLLLFSFDTFNLLHTLILECLALFMIFSLIQRRFRIIPKFVTGPLSIYTFIVILGDRRLYSLKWFWFGIFTYYTFRFIFDKFYNVLILGEISKWRKNFEGYLG